MPKPRKPYPPRRRWLGAFINALRRAPNITAAARAAGVSRAAAYLARRDDPAFATAWGEALAESLDAAEGELYRRAVHGTVKPVYQGGRKVGEVREFSDLLLIFLLKAHRPGLYRERATVFTGHLPIASMTDDELTRLAAGQLPAMATAPTGQANDGEPYAE